VVWSTYASKATTSDAVAQAHRESWRLLEDALFALMCEGSPALQRDDAATLLALLDGLAIARATEADRMSAPRAERIISSFLGRLGLARGPVHHTCGAGGRIRCRNPPPLGPSLHLVWLAEPAIAGASSQRGRAEPQPRAYVPLTCSPRV
jgi:hypothetical protein